MLLVLIYIFVQFAVVALTFAFGGRYERYGALIILIGTVLGALVQMAWVGETRRYALFVVDIGMLVGAAWLFWRHRVVWTGALAMLEATAIPFHVVYSLRLGQPSPEVLQALWWAGSVAAYLQVAVLVFALLRREFGPPHRNPKHAAV